MAERPSPINMDAFETVIASIHQRQGFWTQTSVKVELTKAEKRAIGRQSAPRWELDVVAYRGKTNELRVIECKSYIDSLGVQVATFQGRIKANQARYKLFFEPTLRKVVLGRLKRQFIKAGFCAKNPKVTLCLAAGKIRGDEAWLAAHFAKRGWRLLGPGEIKKELAALQESGYENDVAAVVTKLLLRGRKGADHGQVSGSGKGTRGQGK